MLQLYTDCNVGLRPSIHTGLYNTVVKRPLLLRSSVCIQVPILGRSQHRIANRVAVAVKWIQMLPWVVYLFWILFSLAFSRVLSLPAGLQAGSYELGWITIGVLGRGELPTCTYCINALGDGAGADAAHLRAHKPNWNRTVGLYRCDGAQTNEVWAYQNSSGTSSGSLLGSIHWSGHSDDLCLDAVLWESQLLKLRTCNSSVVTQQWTYENNTLVNGLVHANGKAFYLLAAPPDLGTNPSNMNYTYPLFIANDSPTDFSYTSSFTFLPVTSFFGGNSVAATASTEGLLQIANATKPGQIGNGGFESSKILSGDELGESAWNQSVPSYFSFCGWVIDYGPIDYVNKFLPPQDGTHSIHLNTYTDRNHEGSISQTFRTEVGQKYVLSFFMTGFPPALILRDRPDRKCSPTYLGGGARLRLQVTNATATDSSPGLFSNGSDLVQHFTMNVTDISYLTFGESWTQQIVKFTTSTNVTAISFISLNINDSCGPMIDNVEVSLPPLPSGKQSALPAVVGSIGGVMGFIAILATVYGIRNCRERAYYSGLYKTDHARLYSLRELRTATKKFSSVLGEGGFGIVYKADFADGTAGAVKVEKRKGLNSSSKVLASDEIAVLMRVHHRNLVNLIGFCVHKGVHMLVFEYLPNGSLYDRLHRSVLPSYSAKAMDSVEVGGSSVILWKHRVKIAADVACGLEYLHHQADPPIVHRDVKSSNILLTTANGGKLADFGLSKAAPADATSFQSIETVVKGSIGYLDPQYFLTGVFSPKCDVYSFGVVLLELISGHPAVYNAASLASWAAPYLEKPSLYHELVDKKLCGDYDAAELETLIEVCKMCIQEDGKMRPSMRQVVSFLHSRELPSIGIFGSSKWNEEIPSCESYHNIYQAIFKDLGSPPPTIESFLACETLRE